ncbi:methylenetetrahydrofolate reductase [NAD(P)H] [bacterium]|nr:methylenetetrahydrofolate reductase [NAD(P)H] [bacterium]
MELKEIYQTANNYLTKNPKISFEVFPPKDGNFSNLFEQVRYLKKYNPALISLTYGAGGSTRDLSLEILRSFLDLELNVMPHLTCVGTTKELIEHYLIQIENLGIENILALRGDILEGNKIFDFRHANELVEFIYQKTTLSIGVAGYPEGHIESPTMEQDIENLKRKVDAGASAIFTQLFFNNDKFYKYVETVRNAGINLPIIPGIMPVRNVKQLEKMTSLARVDIPKNFSESLEKFPNDVKKIGTEFAIHQCQDLIDNNVYGLHFFTLNNAEQISDILDNILF